MSIIPLKRNIVLKQDEIAEVNAFGLIIPVNPHQEKPAMGTVVALGDDVGVPLPDNPNPKPSPLTVGCKVLFRPNFQTEVEIKGEKYLILEELAVIAVLTD